MKTDVMELEGVTYDLPTTIRPLGHDKLFVVPLDLIRPADKKDGDDASSDYHWVNPRHYEGEIDGCTPEGFGQEDMDSLLNDIRDDGLIYPLVCRWFLADGEVCVEILDGERRWRSISRLVRENQKCKDRETGEILPASQVYATVPCKVYRADDKESMKIAFMATDRAVKWGDGAKVRLIKRLRSTGCSDGEILELTKKSGQWLREEDKLCGLDDHTFGYYSSGKINRAVALRLADVPIIEQRHKYLDVTYKDAQEADSRRLAKLDEEISRLEEKEELAEAELAEAQIAGDPEAIGIAEDNLAAAQAKTSDRKRQKARGSQAKTKSLRAAVNKLTAEAEAGQSDQPPEEPPESVVQALRPGKIKKQLETLEGLVESEGLDEDKEEVAPPLALQYAIACYRAILNGEENIVRALKRQGKVIKLTEQRKARQAEAN